MTIELRLFRSMRRVFVITVGNWMIWLIFTVLAEYKGVAEFEKLVADIRQADRESATTVSLVFPVEPTVHS